MRKLSRLVFVFLAAALALVIVVLIGANLYVQSQGTQARIQQELSQRLGATLRISRISVTPWGGLKLTGITVPQSFGDKNGDFLEAKAFRLRVRLASLFSKRLVIKEVALIHPTVVWPQNAQGRWRLPGKSDEETSVATHALTETSPSPTEGSSATPTESLATAPTTVPEASHEKSGAAFEPEIRRFNVTHGNFRFLDRAGTLVANFEGVSFRSNLSRPLALRGQTKIDKVSLRDRFFLSSLQSPFRYDPPGLDLPKISARVAGGELNGRFTMQAEATDSPFTVSAKFRDLQADQIVTEAGGPKGTVSGKLEGTFEAQGKTGDADALKGIGEIILRDGQLRQYSLLVALGQVLQIEELTQLHLDEAQAKYHVDPGVVTIDQLILRSPNIRLSATGTIGFNGKLRLESQLAINEKVRGQLFKAIRQNFQPLSEPGLFAVDFQVSGTVDHPKSNLVEKVIGRDLKDLGSVIDSFLGKSKSDRGKKKKSREAEPAESASPSPAVPATSPTP